MKSALAVSLLLVLMGCGGRDTATLPSTESATNLVVIGNSITTHGPNEAIGWSGNWGMAASAADKDFAHLTAAKLGVPLSANHFAALETTPTTAVASIPDLAAKVTARSAVVVELGDNVSTDSLSAFQPAYSQLLQSVSTGQKLICTSTFWHNTLVDDVLRAECNSHGGTYVFIGDIYTDPSNPDRQSTAFSDPGVNSHPHDWGMARIAERILQALR